MFNKQPTTSRIAQLGFTSPDLLWVMDQVWKILAYSVHPSSPGQKHLRWSFPWLGVKALVHFHSMLSAQGK